MRINKLFWKYIMIAVFIQILLDCTAVYAGSIGKSAASGDIEGIKKYIEKGEDINKPDKEGLTPLIWASYYGQTDAVKFLAGKGADINYQLPKDYGSVKKGSTALIIASYYNFVEVVQTLIAQGANKNLKTRDNETALNIAKQNELSDIVELFDTRTKTPEELEARIPRVTIVLNNGSVITGKVVYQDRNIARVKLDNKALQDIGKENIMHLMVTKDGRVPGVIRKIDVIKRYH
jgi:ankyrin repeat protein